MEGGRGQVEVERFGEADGPASLRAPTKSGEQLRRVSEPGEGSCGRAGGVPEDRNCDRWIWGSGSGGEGGVGYVNYRRGGLSNGGEGARARDQPDFRRAPGNGGIWSKRVGRADSSAGFMKKVFTELAKVENLRSVEF